MAQTCSRPVRHALNGPTMGTRWSALVFAPPGFDTAPLRAALQAAVDRVDAQMSLWKPDSDLVRLNAAAPGAWIELPAELAAVLRLGLEIGRASGGAFDIGVGDAAAAWGFGPAPASTDGIRAAGVMPRRPADAALLLDGRRVRKRAGIALDLSGIAKGFGVDRLADTLRDWGITAGLVGIDGEMRALGLRPDGEAWTIAVERPDPDRRAVHAVLALQDAAVATSGDYRHWVTVQGRRLSHTMHPARGVPLDSPPSSVTVVARSCAVADAWATALMVLGVEHGSAVARSEGLDALFLTRGAAGAIESRGVGRLFAGPDAVPA